MRHKNSIAGAALTSAALLAMAWPSPASAVAKPDLKVTTAINFALTGIQANGRGSVCNVGGVEMPAGSTVHVEFTNMPGKLWEPHVNAVVPSDITAVSAIPAGLMAWKLELFKPLAPQACQKFTWQVLHYAPWHRVRLTTKVLTTPAIEGSTANNIAVLDNL